MHEMIHFGAFCDVSGLFTEKQESTSLFSTAKLLLFEDMYWPFTVFLTPPLGHLGKHFVIK